MTSCSVEPVKIRLRSGVVVAGLIAVAAFGALAAVEADADPSDDIAVAEADWDDAPTLAAVLFVVTVTAVVATRGETVPGTPVRAPGRIHRGRARDRSPPLS